MLVSLQDVQKVAKYCVKKAPMVLNQADASAFSNDIISTYTDSSGTKEVVNALTMNPHGLIYAMINSIKQLDSTVTSLQNQLNSRRPVRDTTTQTDTTLNIELANSNDIILYQNQPNPFSSSTVIRYFIPENTSGDIYISFSDMYGGEIKKVEITNKGFGKIDAGTENLISFSDSLNGYVGGNGGILYKTNNGGLGWSAEVSNDTNSIIILYTFDSAAYFIDKPLHIYKNEPPTGVTRLKTYGIMANISPNPSHGIFDFQLQGINEKTEVEIYNMLGKQVYNETLRQAQGDNTIDLSEQPAGIYLYRIIAENGTAVASGKLVIQ